MPSPETLGMSRVACLLVLKLPLYHFWYQFTLVPLGKGLEIMVLKLTAPIFINLTLSFGFRPGAYEAVAERLGDRVSIQPVLCTFYKHLSSQNVLFISCSLSVKFVPFSMDSLFFL